MGYKKRLKEQGFLSLDENQSFFALSPMEQRIKFSNTSIIPRRGFRKMEIFGRQNRGLADKISFRMGQSQFVKMFGF